jgi:anti-sigma regulatory factor (Ser/Thr protein kinase)
MVCATAVAGMIDPERDRPGRMKRVIRQTFAAEPHMVAGARRFVRDALVANGLDTDVVTLLTSELASNVVQHASTQFEVVFDVRPPLVRVEIHDGAAVTQAFRDLVQNPPSDVDVEAAGGRGLLLLGSTTAAFGLIDKGPDGKAIWFEVEVTADA